MDKNRWYSVSFTSLLLLTVLGSIFYSTNLETTKVILLTIANAIVFILSLVANIIQIGVPGMFKRSIKNWNYSFEIANKLLSDIESSGKKIDLVIGLGRSGGIWGGWLAGNLGSLPFYTLDIKYSVDENGDRQIEFPHSQEILQLISGNTKCILVIEGAASTGNTFAAFKKKHLPLFSNVNFKFAVLFKNSSASITIDYVGKILDNGWPKKFPWHRTDKYQTLLKEI